MSTKPAIKSAQEVLDKGKSMLQQTKAEGSKAFAGSSYDKSTPPIKSTPPVKDTPTDTGRYKRTSKPTTPAYTPEEAGARAVLYDTKPFNEDERRQQLIKQKKGQMSALDAVYDSEVKVQLKAGEKDLGRSNTISALTGMMGGPEATTRAGNANRRTDERVNLVNEKRGLALQKLYSEVDTVVAAEKNAQLETQRSNAKNVLDEIATKAATVLNGFAAEGVSWDDLKTSDPETYETLIRQSGKDAFTLQKLYEDAMPKEVKPELLFSGWKGNNYVTIKQHADGTIKTETFDQAELGIPDDFTDPESITVGGNVYWYDKEKPLKADGTPNLILVGAKGGSGTGGGGSSPISDENGDIMSFDDWKRGPEAKKILEDYRKQELATKGTSGMTTSMADQMLRPIYNEGLKKYKTSTAKKGTNYTATNIPSPVKADLIADIKSGSATIADLYEAYPDVSSSYVSSMYNSLTPKKKKEEETTMSDEEFKNLLMGGK